MLKFVVVVSMCFFISGCASTTAEQVGQGMQLGTTGSGIVGLPIFLAGIVVEKTGRAMSRSSDSSDGLNVETKRMPKLGEYSAKVQKVIDQTPTPVVMAAGAQPTWNPRLYMVGDQEKTATIENTPPDIMALRQLIHTAQTNFTEGKLGSDPAQHNKNMVAWATCGKVVAEYKGSFGKRVVVTSTGCSPAKMMLYDEWMAENGSKI